MTTTTRRWSRFAPVCRDCNRRFRIDLDTLAETRKLNHFVPSATDEQIATYVEFCLECSGGVHDTGEFVDENPAARRWDPKGWALDTLARMVAAVLAMDDLPAKEREFEEEPYILRLRRCAFVAQALRARIDGRY